ncbi:hypothetical protein [Halodesulfovibrio sp. MK-HDV]|uniref:hypothetical protein n=1 Tax=unclassified Halodesulfovibrio TaxID=2644657 RepID=UPI00136F3A73|nr:hypothetical protein [Halodesulfovibrio sp. MK-HDV]
MAKVIVVLTNLADGLVGSCMYSEVRSEPFPAGSAFQAAVLPLMRVLKQNQLLLWIN